MKFSRMLSASLFCAQILWSSLSFALTQAQKAELYERGTISVLNEQGQTLGHYEVRFMPGSENIQKRSQEALQESYRLLAEMADKDQFWKKDVGGSFLDGVRHIKTSAYDKGVMGIADDFQETTAKNAQIANEFGSTAGCAYNWLGFGGKAIARTIWGAMGVAGGAMWAVGAPVVQVVARPMVAGFTASIGGIAYPLAQYAWNGSAWALTKSSEAPSKDSMLVVFVPAKDSAESRDNQSQSEQGPEEQV